MKHEMKKTEIGQKLSIFLNLFFIEKRLFIVANILPNSFFESFVSQKYHLIQRKEEFFLDHPVVQAYQNKNQRDLDFIKLKNKKAQFDNLLNKTM
jgi:uncharacterized protein YrrD